MGRDVQRLNLLLQVFFLSFLSFSPYMQHAIVVISFTEVIEEPNGDILLSIVQKGHLFAFRINFKRCSSFHGVLIHPELSLGEEQDQV